MSHLEIASDPTALLEGLRVDAQPYFDNAMIVLHDLVEECETPFSGRASRNTYWDSLPEESRQVAGRLIHRLVSLASEIVPLLKRAALVSEADHRDVTTAAKTMRAALLLRQHDEWTTEVIHDEGTILGVNPPGQSDNAPCAPAAARARFNEWAEKLSSILQLATASTAMVSTDQQVGQTARYRPGTAFIMMSMDKSRPELNDVCDAVKDTFRRFGINAVRADDIEHEGLITRRVLDEIQTAEYCFADMSGGRPNVYYEVGYAHALNRRVIMFRKKGDGLHFDVAGYNCPEYENLRDLKEKLTSRLRAVTNKTPIT